MVMWFGFDWQSKAAVVVIMTFFPMLVNTHTGIAASGQMERDLMYSYASNYWQTLLLLRLPNALPFIFNAMKINSTLALIGAIVAEFFGTPIVGMGFRISIEVGRMNVDVVWATILVAAMSGSFSKRRELQDANLFQTSEFAHCSAAAASKQCKATPWVLSSVDTGA